VNDQDGTATLAAALILLLLVVLWIVTTRLAHPWP